MFSNLVKGGEVEGKDKRGAQIEQLAEGMSDEEILDLIERLSAMLSEED